MTPHIILFVADKARAVQFYRQVLELAPRLDVPGMAEFELPGGVVLGLMPATGVKRLLDLEVPSHGVPRVELYLLGDDVDGAWARALAAGATAIQEPALRDWGHRAAYCYDPEGHLLAFAEPAQ